MNIFKISIADRLLQRKRSLISTPIAVLLFFLVMSTSALADLINVSVNIGNNGFGSGSVTPGLPSFLIQDAAGPGVCGICVPGTHSPSGTSFLLHLDDTSIGNTHEGHLHFHGPATWEQPLGDPASPLTVTFPVTFEGSYASSGGPTDLVGNGTGSILLDIPFAGAGNARFYLGSTYTVTATAMPEPATALLLATGVALLLWAKTTAGINVRST